MTNKTRTCTLVVRVTEEIKAEIMELAEADERSVDYILREAIIYYLAGEAANPANQKAKK